MTVEHAAQRTSGNAIAALVLGIATAGTVLGWVGVAITAVFALLFLLVMLAFVA